MSAVDTPFARQFLQCLYAALNAHDAPAIGGAVLRPRRLRGSPDAVSPMMLKEARRTSGCLLTQMQ